MLWGNTAYCVKLGGEDLPRYSNRTESVGWRKFPHCHYINKKLMSPDNEHFSDLAPRHGGKTAGIDKAWRNYVSVALCIRTYLFGRCCRCNRADTGRRRRQRNVLRWYTAVDTRLQQQTITASSCYVNDDSSINQTISCRCKWNLYFISPEWKSGSKQMRKKNNLINLSKHTKQSVYTALWQRNTYKEYRQDTQQKS